MHMGISYACMSVQHMHSWYLWKLKRCQISSGVVVSHPLGSGNQTQVLWKVNQYSSPLSILSSPKVLCKSYKN